MRFGSLGSLSESRVYLAPDGLEGGSVEDAGSAVAPETGAVEGGTEGDFSYDWTDPSGKHMQFSREELGSYLTERTLAKGDYSRNMDALTRDREILARDRRDFDGQATSLNQIKAEYRSFQEAMDRNPALFREFKARLSRGGSPDDAFERSKAHTDDRYSSIEKRLDAYDEEKAQAAADKGRADAIAKLQSEFPDFNAEKVGQFLSGIRDEEALQRYGYHAMRGQANPAHVEALAAAEEEEGRRVRGSSKSTSKPPPSGRYSSVEEARAAAHRANPS